MDKQPEHEPAESEDYETPALTDLGSFEEVTRQNPGGGQDFEGTSGGPN